MPRTTTRIAGLAGVVVVSVVVTVAVRGNPAPAAPATLPSTTALVVRTDLSSTVLTAGTLGYAPSDPVVNHMAGTYTWLQPQAANIAPGQTLYKVDNMSVVLMTGSVPAWRAFAPGMTDGPDIGQLESGLIAAGDARGLFSAPSDHFSALTGAAIRRWQTGTGLAVTGQVALGTIVFLPGRIRIAAPQVTLGQQAVPGDQPYLVSTTSRVVTVPLTSNLPTVAPGQVVSILLPDGSSTSGKADSIAPVPPPAGQSGQSGSGSSGSSSSSTPTELVVTPDDPGATGVNAGVPVQVSLTVQSVKSVLAVPVPALLALAGGGYGLEVVTPSGAHQLVGVHTGVFAGGRVQVTGAAIRPGVRVVVAQ